MAWLCANFNQEEKQEDLAKVQQFFVDCMDLAHTAYPTLAKYALQKRGLPITLYTRRNVEPLTPEITSAMDNLLAIAARLAEEVTLVPVLSYA